MFRSIIHLSFGLAIVASVLSHIANAQDFELRKWLDKTGKHELQATFVSLDGEEVLLEMKDGKKMKIKLDQLSFNDQKYAIDASSKMELDNPFKASSGTTSEPASAGAAEPKVITVRWNNARTLNPRLAPEEWSLEPDPAPNGGAVESNAIPLPKQRDFFEKYSGTVVNAKEGLVCIGHTLDRGGNKNTRLEVIDLVSSKIIHQAVIDKLWAPLAVTDGGTTVILKSNDFGFGGKERLTIWRMNNDDTATPLRGWICSQQGRGSGRDIEWAAAVQNNRLATLTADGRLTIWDYETGEPKAYMDMGRNAHASVSPGGKYIICGVGSALVAIEPGRSRLVASTNIEDAEDQSARATVSPDGTKFAFGFSSTTHVYDFATAKQQQEVVGISTFGEMAWANPNYLLAGSSRSRSLINLDHGFVVWTYTGMEDAFRFGDYTWFVTGNRDSAALLGLELPRRDAREAVERAFNDPDFFAVTDGKSVRIDVSKISDGAERQKAQDALEQKMAANGIGISESAPVTIEAEVKRGESREVEFRSFGMFHFEKGDVRNVASWISSLRVKEGENILWEGHSTVFPYHVSIREGENLDGALARMDKPNYSFFSTIAIPKNIPREGGRNGLGTTDLSKDGF